MKSSKLVSIRIPESMLKELERLAASNHFLDLSEQVRAVVRNRWRQEIGNEKGK